MDRKTIAIFAACIVLLGSWTFITNRLYPPIPIPENTNTVASVTNGYRSGSNTTTASISSNSTVLSPASGGTFVAGRSQRPLVTSSAPEETIVVTNGEARYTFTSYGGGLKLVELTHYPEDIVSSRLAHHTNDFAALNVGAPLPVLAIVGDDRLEGDGVFKLSRTAGGVRAEKTLPGGVLLTKDFEIGSNYIVTADVRFMNNSTGAVTVPAQRWVTGTATPMNLRLEHGLVDYGKTPPPSQYVNVLWWNGEKPASVPVQYFDTNTTKMWFFSRTPLQTYDAGSNNVGWVSVQNQFFALTVLPKNPAENISVHMIDLPTAPQENADPSKPGPAIPGLEATAQYPALTLNPGQVADLQWTIYAGPKEYKTLSRVASYFGSGLDSVMGFSGFFVIAKWMLLAMNWMHSVLHISYGWLVVVLTAVIRIIFWPLTRMSTRSMKRMQELQPQMKAMQERYKDDPQKLSQKQLEFWKKNKINPLGGCLPMLLQIPIFVGYYRMLQSAIELRGASFLWAHDLSQPDTIFYIPGLDIPVNPMPLMMGATMLWQTSLAPPSPGMDPSQQKIMKFMPLIFVFMFYRYSSGLALYMTVSNLLTVLQTKLTKTQTPAAAGATPSAPAPAAARKKN